MLFLYSPEDSHTAHLVHNLTASLKAKLEKPIGFTSVPLDARFTTIRQRESNYANFVYSLTPSLTTLFFLLRIILTGGCGDTAVI